MNKLEVKADWQPLALVRPRKYEYIKIIQTNHGYGWEDATTEVCDSLGIIRDPSARARHKENVKLYRQEARAAVRVVTRRTKLESIK